MARDIVHNTGFPRSVPPGGVRGRAEPGGHPGAVVFRNEVSSCCSTRPRPTTVTSRSPGLVPAADQQVLRHGPVPRRSFVEYCVEQGFQVYAVSWRNPTRASADWDLDTYVDAVEEAMAGGGRDQRGATRSKRSSLCAGGITTARSAGPPGRRRGRPGQLRHLRRHPAGLRVPSMIGHVRRAPRSSRNSVRASDRVGHPRGQRAARALLHACAPTTSSGTTGSATTSWGTSRSAFDVMAWNADSTALPAALHARVPRHVPAQLVGGGRLSVLGAPVDLSQGRVRHDGRGRARTDHLIPWKACYARLRALRWGQPIRPLVLGPHPVPGQPAGIGQDDDHDRPPTRARARARGLARTATEAPGVWWSRGRSGRRPVRVPSAGAGVARQPRPPARRPAPGDYVLEPLSDRMTSDGSEDDVHDGTTS